VSGRALGGSLRWTDTDFRSLGCPTCKHARKPRSSRPCMEDRAAKALTKPRFSPPYRAATKFGIDRLVLPRLNGTPVRWRPQPQSDPDLGPSGDGPTPWIAHQLEVTTTPDRRVQGARTSSRPEGRGAGGCSRGSTFDDEIDLRAEDDALIAAELEAEARRRAEEEGDEDEGDGRRGRGRRRGQGPKRRPRRSAPRRAEGRPYTGPATGRWRQDLGFDLSRAPFDHGRRGATACGFDPRAWGRPARSTQSTGPATGPSR